MRAYRDPSVLTAPGGFAWWYLDLVDRGGNGAVLIWSFGLPFLPGYLGRARGGAPERPVDRPSLSVAVYEGGRQSFYLLAEERAHAARWDASGFLVGRTHVAITASDGRLTVRATIDADLPLEQRVRGEIVAESPLLEARPQHLGFADTLLWQPIAVGGEGSYALVVEDGHGARARSFTNSGLAAYHDHNRGTRPFDRYGIARWVWGRVALGPQRERVYYLVEPEATGEPTHAIGLEIEGDRVRERVLEVPRREARRGWFGMPWERTLSLTADGAPWLDVVHGTPLEDGPFYLRMMGRARTADGAEGHGTAEVVCPSRIDGALLRPLVRMRVRPPEGEPPSRWSPLFLGPRRGRWERTLRSFARR
ncbi:MAG: hydroxyneurosporene dehydrogenase [Sandaracinaceae bacterium]